MAEFVEDQRIVIRALAEEEAARVLNARQLAQDASLDTKVGRVIDGKLPRLLAVERVLSTWWGIMAIVVAVPLASAGAIGVAKSLLDSGLKRHVDTAMQDETGPIQTSLKRLDSFSGKLSAQFDKHVDSANSKLLRFGCNKAGAVPVDGLAACLPVRTLDSAPSQARDILEVHDQTLIFKANRETQRVHLQLRLSPIDGVDALKNVGLRLMTPNILSTERAGVHHTLNLVKTDLPDTHDFIDGGGLLKLYGGVADLDDQQPLRIEVEITRLLREKADLHALRFRAEPLGPTGRAAHRGGERFFVHAVVVVTHRFS